MLKNSFSSKFKKRSGSGMLITAIALCVITAAIGLSSARLANLMFSTVHNTGINMQANEYAQDLAEKIRSTTYGSLESQIRTAIGTTGYFDTITIGNEITIDNSGVRQKAVTIDIYYGRETNPRASLSIKRSNWNNAGCPIGSIVAWDYGTAPSDGGVWLLCTGQTIPTRYTALRRLVGDKTPDFRGKFLRGYGSLDMNRKSGELLQVQMDSDPLMTGTFYTYVPQYIAHKNTSSSPWNSGYFNKEFFPATGTFRGDVASTVKYQTRLDRGRKSENYTYMYQITFDNKNFYNTSAETKPINVAVNFLIKAL